MSNLGLSAVFSVSDVESWELPDVDTWDESESDLKL